MTIPSRPAIWAAHTPSKKNRNWHLMTDHTLGVADRAEQFAAAFDTTKIASSWARYLGLLHDLGKYTDKFQNYLWACHLAGLRGTPPPKRGSAPHKQMGALAIYEDLKEAGALFALPVFGHHGGMIMPSETYNKTVGSTDVDEVRFLRMRASGADPRLTAQPPNLELLQNSRFAQFQEMFLRMLFSCLTDADALDTEQHMNPADAKKRKIDALTIVELRDALAKRQERDFDTAPPSVVNQVRKEVHAACLQAASLSPGVFELTVPTGGGKTRSGLAFALEHAAAHGLRRIVYAIPYTSIVDQTAAVFRDLFGDDPGVVLEHHSAIEPISSEETNSGMVDAEFWRRLASQNWDAPLVVTTTVQLFESLFSNRPGACRKLHRLAHSVIVLDEVQTLPANLLAPLVDGLKTLTACYGVSIVLCTATQPALEGKVSHFLDGFPSVSPIVPKPDRDRHFGMLRRVRYRVEADGGGWDWARVADEMHAGGSSLCILNTRRQARQLMDALDLDRCEESVFHLSTLMCGHHRRAVLKAVGERLLRGLSTLLVSTSLVECGIDLDFPRVLRAIGPLDRIIQAAGRCNREGRRPRDESEVIVFTPAEGGAPGGLYLTALQSTIQLYRTMKARNQEIDFDDPELVTRYFKRLYGDLQGSVDKAADGHSVQERRAMYDYAEVARDVKLVNEDTVSVLVTGYDSADLGFTVSSLRDEADAIGGMTRLLWQKAQPLCVSLPRVGAESGKLGLASVPGGLYLWEGEYNPKTGIPLPEDMAAGPVYRSGHLTV